jgi:hypothetical protein
MLTPYVIGLAFANCAASVCLTAVFRTLEFMEHQKGIRRNRDMAPIQRPAVDRCFPTG